ncbi:glycosyltransferase [Lutibacter sp.]|uniref:glycosyltransferase n=1 Tax=Lutibacter sp. TaxID=1925666 RepID=UPI0025BED50A|nr:glycosyltransferase [Lutibacter sp.]MCF6168483.1 glycosyltransferase [Lutibacter sp.]
MKKIVFVIESLSLGGAEKSLVTLLQNLDYSQYNVDLITFKKKGFFREFVPKEVNCIILTIPKLSLIDRVRYLITRKLISNQHNAQLFWSIIQNKFKKVHNNYDIAIAYNQGLVTYFVNKYIFANKKYAWLNTDYKKAGYNIAFDYPIYKNLDGVIAVSTETKMRLDEELNKINKKMPIEIIKDITDQKIIQQQAGYQQKVKFNKNKLNLVSVGRLVSSKGFKLAIEACKILLDKGYPIQWYIVGEGSERENLEKSILRNKLEGCFFLIGADSNPYTYMKKALIYVQTSLFEGLGLTVVEASYLYKPIVSTNFPTIHGIIKDGKTGLVAEMNAESIAIQIERLILDETLRNKLTYNLSKQKNKEKEKSLDKIYTLFKK